MSGGYFDYKNSYLCHELFDWNISAQRGIEANPEYKKALLQARKCNPMGDRILSELVFDVFCLLDALDYWRSSDTSEEEYRDDVVRFKTKWLKAPTEDLVTREIENTVNEMTETISTLKEELYRDLLWVGGSNEENRK